MLQCHVLVGWERLLLLLHCDVEEGSKCVRAERALEVEAFFFTRGRVFQSHHLSPVPAQCRGSHQNRRWHQVGRAQLTGSEAGLLFRGTQAGTLWNPARTNASSCPWEKRNLWPRYRLGPDGFGSCSAEKGLWVVGSKRTRATHVPWHQTH